MIQQYPSQLLQKAVDEFATLPGVGRKTALRLVLYLLRQPSERADSLSEAVRRARHEVRYCRVCHNISDQEVENVQDVMAIENTQQYNGLYHVLGGVISPMDGIGPGDLEIDSLVSRVEAGGVDEVIFALASTMEGDTTNFYVSRRLQPTGVRTSVIARGISVGAVSLYTDEVTLGRSILCRTPLETGGR